MPIALLIGLFQETAQGLFDFGLWAGKDGTEQIGLQPLPAFKPGDLFGPCCFGPPARCDTTGPLVVQPPYSPVPTMPSMDTTKWRSLGLVRTQAFSVIHETWTSRTSSHLARTPPISPTDLMPTNLFVRERYTATTDSGLSSYPTPCIVPAATARTRGACMHTSLPASGPALHVTLKPACPALREDQANFAYMLKVDLAPKHTCIPLLRMPILF